MVLAPTQEEHRQKTAQYLVQAQPLIKGRLHWHYNKIADLVQDTRFALNYTVTPNNKKQTE